ncbi:hypothetical protein GCM10023068_16540 [Leifsonia shinshuensis]
MHGADRARANTSRANKKGTVRTDSAHEDGGMVAAHHMVAVAGLDMVAAGEEVAAREEAALGPVGHPR